MNENAADKGPQPAAGSPLILAQGVGPSETNALRLR